MGVFFSFSSFPFFSLFGSGYFFYFISFLSLIPSFFCMKEHEMGGRLGLYIRSPLCCRFLVFG